jgi:cytosine/adenosine deaminase-related metal-dependent hydrolase
MLLNNVTFVNDSQPSDILVSEDKILAAGKMNTIHEIENPGIHFTNAIAFPGLINSHDHLDFNCFAPLGQKKYKNYTEWGNHIHTTYKEDINAVLKIPQQLRSRWGMYKNLLAGVTTVINHGDLLEIENPLINIYQELQNLHSVKFQKKWKWKLNNPLLKNKTCVIHTGEGTDEPSADEIDELLNWNLLNRKLVGVHAVAMNPRQAKKFTGLVWCPESNHILLDRHADIARLKENTRVVFGTDSTLTGSWNIWHHLRQARTLQMAKDAELFAMVTSAAAQLWKLNKGEIRAGTDADIVIAKTENGNAAWDDFFSINPEDILMVLQKGKIRMFDKTIAGQINSRHIHLKKFNPVSINGVIKFVEGDIPALINAIRRYHPDVMLPSGICETGKNSGND